MRLVVPFSFFTGRGGKSGLSLNTICAVLTIAPREYVNCGIESGVIDDWSTGVAGASPAADTSALARFDIADQFGTSSPVLSAT